MLVAEGDVAMDEIADRLDTPPSGRGLLKESPGHLGQAVGLAVATRSNHERDARLKRDQLVAVLYPSLALAVQDRDGFHVGMGVKGRSVAGR